jgi:hypothetical protein
MFGHDKDEDKNDPDLAVAMPTKPVSHGLLGIDDDDSTTTSPPAPASSTSSDEPSGAPITPSGVDDFAASVPSPAPSLSDDSTTSFSPATPPADDSATPAPAPASSTSSDELLNIKRQALEELSPLIDHLEQDSEEKFKTTMMMIQASDNQSLVPQAFQAAKEIKDEPKRAQALLDIVNEINYFTHKTED